MANFPMQILAQEERLSKDSSVLPSWFVNRRVYRKAQTLLQRQAQGAIFGNRQKRVIARYQRLAQALRQKGAA